MFLQFFRFRCHIRGRSCEWVVEQGLNNETARLTDGTTDQELVKLALEGDAGAFERLHRRYVHGVLTWISLGGVHRNDVEAVAQDVFIVFWSNLRKFKKGRPVRAWLQGITRKKIKQWMDAQYKRRRLPTEETENLDGIIDPQSEEPEAASQRIAGLARRIEAVLRELKTRDRVLFDLRVSEGLSYREIERVLRRSSVALRKQFARIVEKIIRELEGD